MAKSRWLLKHKIRIIYALTACFRTAARLGSRRSPLSQVHWTCSRASRAGWTVPYSPLVLDLMGLQVQVGAI